MVLRHRSFVTETYEVQDLFLYDPMTSDSGHWSWSNTLSKSFSSNGCRLISDSANGYSYFNGQLPNEYELQATFDFENNQNKDMIVVGNYQTSHGVYNSVSRIMIFNAWPPNYTETLASLSNGTYRFVVQDNKLSIYGADTLLIQGSITGYQNIVGFITYASNRSRTVKDVKIKPL